MGADSQNWVMTPSPPDATGWKSGFASQLAPQSHASVVFGVQYAVLAKCVYGAKDAISAGGTAVMLLSESCRRQGAASATGASAAAARSTVAG